MMRDIDDASAKLRGVISDEYGAINRSNAATPGCPKFPVFCEAYESDEWDRFKNNSHITSCSNCQKIVAFFETRGDRFGEKDGSTQDSGKEQGSETVIDGESSELTIAKSMSLGESKLKKRLMTLGALAASMMLIITAMEFLNRSATVANAAPDDPYELWNQALQMERNIAEPEKPSIEEAKPAAISVEENSQLDQKLFDALNAAPVLPITDKAFISMPSRAAIVAGTDQIWIDRVHQVTSTRNIYQNVTWADPSGLHLGQLVDALAFLKTGILNPVRGLETRPMRFVLEGMWPTEFGDTSPLAATMESTDLEGFVEALQKIVADRLKADKRIYFPFRQTDYRFEEASSVEELSVKLAISGSYMGAFKAAFEGFHAKRSDRRLVYLYLRQPMFRVSLVESNLSGFVSTLPEDAEKAVQQRRPGYVNSITMGRVIFAAFETSADSKLLKAALSWQVNGMVAEIDGELKTRYEKVINESKMRVFVHGGMAQPIFETDTSKAVVQLKKYLNETVQFSPQNLPAAIGFEVRDLQTGDLIGKKEVSEYSAFEEPNRSGYQYNITLTSANIRDDHDGFGSGDGDWLVQVNIPGHGNVLHAERDLDEGNHTINHRVDNVDAPASQIHFELHAREKDGFPNGDDDDVTHRNHRINLAEMARKLSDLPIPNAQSSEHVVAAFNDACRQEFTLTTPSGNVFNFVLDLIPPRNGD